MVANIVPGSSAATGALSVETRVARPQLSLPQKSMAQAPRDVVEVSTASPWDVARDSVTAGLDALDLAIALGRAGLGQLGQEPFGADAAAVYNRTVSGSSLLVGDNVEVTAEPNAAAYEIEGVDARLDGETNVAATATLLRTHLARFESAAHELEAHAALFDAATNGGAGLDADGARLLALQVRQGLEGRGDLAITQADSVLSFFRA
jgi:hypothetical protein